MKKWTKKWLFAKGQTTRSQLSSFKRPPLLPQKAYEEDSLWLQMGDQAPVVSQNLEGNIHSQRLLGSVVPNLALVEVPQTKAGRGHFIPLFGSLTDFLFKDQQWLQ